MIEWSVQHKTAPAGETFLSPLEQERAAGLRTEKRRKDWLLGRWTAKLLLQAVVHRDAGVRLDLTEIVIENDATGAPHAVLHSQVGSLPVHLSISHANECSFCALRAGLGLVSGGQGRGISVGLLGADIESVQPRPAGFVEDYFTETEIALLNGAPAGTWSRDMLVTATWSAKEAALKALKLGLRVDTRSVTCLIEPVVDPPQEWTPFDIHWDVKRLNHCSADAALKLGAEPDRLVGWWRILDGYVLTLASSNT